MGFRCGSPFAKCQTQLTASKNKDHFRSFQNIRDQIGANVSWGHKNKIARYLRDEKHN